MQICDARVHACTKNEIGTTSTVLATTCSNIILYKYDSTVSVGRILSYLAPPSYQYPTHLMALQFRTRIGDPAGNSTRKKVDDQCYIIAIFILGS